MKKLHPALRWILFSLTIIVTHLVVFTILVLLSGWYLSYFIPFRSFNDFWRKLDFFDGGLFFGGLAFSFVGTAYLMIAITRISPRTFLAALINTIYLIGVLIYFCTRIHLVHDKTSIVCALLSQSIILISSIFVTSQAKEGNI